MSTYDAETRQPGSVFAWGDDEYNQLGFEGSEQTFTKVDGRKFLAEPVLNDEFEGLGIVQVAAGQRHSLALDEFGNVWSCGRGSEGQLGLGDRIGRGKPTRVGAALDNYRCVAVACGPDCSAVITQDGHLYEWGLMHYVPETPGSVAAAAASAAGGTSNPSVAMPGLASARPVSKRLQKLLRDSTMKYLSAKPTTKLASLPEGVTMNDYVYESSDSEDDERRDTSQDTEQQRERARRKAETEEAGVKSVRTRRHPACWPVLCKELSGIRLVSIAFGYGSVLVLSENGDVYSKGFNDRGQLGIGSRLNQVTFQKVDFSASQILTEDEYMLEALEADDGGGVSGLPPAVEGEGENVRRSSSQSTSSSVSHFSTHMVKLACGSTHCMCLSVDGAVFVWGSNVFGQLGMGEGHSDFVRPVLNRALNAIAGPISDVACGSHHSSAINSDGVLFSWGHSEYGQHGAGVSGGHDLRYGAYLKYYHTPRRIPPFDSANGPRLVSISCVDLFTVALDTHGRPWSWGWDTHGALGHGRALIRQHPQIIAKLDGIEVAQVAAGYKHVIALTKPEGFRFALRFRPLFLQSLHGAPSWVVDLGEHHDILIVSNHRSWAPASESSSGTKKPKARRAPVKGHRYIIFARCPPLRVLYDDAVADRSMAKLKLKDDASNGDEKEQLVEICLPGPHEPLVVQALVEYLYTDQVRGCPPHRFNDLANLANQLGLTRLTSLCAKLQHARKLQAGLDGLLSKPRIASVAQLAASVAQNTSVGGIAAAASLANQELSATDNSVSNAEIVEEETQEKEVEQPKLAASTFSQDMEQAVNNDEFSDVMFSLEDDDAIIGTDIEEEESAGTLQPLGKKRPPIAVHRTILARFPFFNRLLNSGFAESIKMQSGEAVPLTGVSYDTFYAMLHWLYTGNTKVVDETNVLEILAGARCFGMDVLASHCENFVLDRIDVENAPELLSFAESINAPRLLGECKAKLEQNQKPIVDK